MLVVVVSTICRTYWTDESGTAVRLLCAAPMSGFAGAAPMSGSAVRLRCAAPISHHRFTSAWTSDAERRWGYSRASAKFFFRMLE